jgi:hypothetical protein
MLVIAGLVVLAVVFFGARLLNWRGQAGAAVFIWVWLVASIVNGAIGVGHAGIPVINEIGAFIPIFGGPRRQWGAAMHLAADAAPICTH